jgi:hypothetical protein
MITLTKDVAEAQVELFSSLIWNPDDLIEVRILPKRQRIFTTAEKLKDHVDTLWELNQDGQNIYVGVNPRIRKGGKTEDVKCFRTFFVDWDGVSLDYVSHAYEAAGVETPTIIIASGHGYHAYWRLKDEAVSVKKMDAASWSAYQRGLITVILRSKIRQGSCACRDSSTLRVMNSPRAASIGMTKKRPTFQKR